MLAVSQLFLGYLVGTLYEPTKASMKGRVIVCLAPLRGRPQPTGPNGVILIIIIVILLQILPDS